MENYTKKISKNDDYAPMSRDVCDIIKEVKMGSKIVAIASSTGGPHALHSVIPQLPENLDAPILLVQHMPKGFTKALADRLNELSRLNVKEAVEGEELKKGTVYIARGGAHMKVYHSSAGRYCIRYSDEPLRDGVKPNANYMYESISGCKFGRAVCVVLTGMGMDGTEGITALKKTDDTYVIAQNEETCTVYGMPGSVVKAGLSDAILPLEHIAHEIVRQVGVQ